MSDQIRIQLETTAVDARSEEEEAEGAEDYSILSSDPLKWVADSPLGDARFVDPVTLMITGTLAVIAIRLVNHWLKKAERGVQIDLRSDPPTISRLVNVPAGVIVFIDRSGKASVHRERYAKPEDLLPTLKRFLTAGHAS